jgi:hypothetical protein
VASIKIVIFRNMLISLGGHPPRDSSSRENIPPYSRPYAAGRFSRSLRGHSFSWPCSLPLLRLMKCSREQEGQIRPS